LDRIEAKFGKARLAVFDDRRIRGDILDWRDQWADKPRSADMAIQVISRLLSWAEDRGRLGRNHALGIGQLYAANRSDLIWTAEHFETFNAHATVEVREGVDLAACTGLRRGDLVQVPWSAVGEHAIVWQTGKSRGRARIVIPLLPETRNLLERIKARHAAEMAAVKPEKRKPLPETILSNSFWRPWTAMGFGSRFNDAKQASGVELNLHDVRGTFATRCMIAGLTDQEIADILGWSTKDVASIRVKYVDQARVVVAIGKRISGAGE
jgi:integrase